MSQNSDTYRNFSPRVAEELLSMLRSMFPHKEVAENAYRYVIGKLDNKCDEDQNLATLLSEGVDKFQWSSLSETTKRNVLERSEGTLFLKRLKAEFVVWFYSNPEVWRHFGYEGPSNDKGGYLNRGFNDIDWIDRMET